MIKVSTCSSCLHFDSYLLTFLEFSLRIIVHCIAAIIAENEQTPLANLPSDSRYITDLDTHQESDHEKGVPEFFFPLFCISVAIHSFKDDARHWTSHNAMPIFGACRYNFSRKPDKIKSQIMHPLPHNCF